MRIVIGAVGRLKAGPERDLVERYRSRAADLAPRLGCSGPDLVEFPESRARRPEDRKSEEGAALLTRIGPGVRIVLDERGAPLTSEAFARQLGAWREAGQPAAHFLIGGADGLAPDLVAGATLRLAFGAMTLPHQIVRALVVEQLYRAMTILSGHPYHRA